MQHHPHPRVLHLVMSAEGSGDQGVDLGSTPADPARVRKGVFAGQGRCWKHTGALAGRRCLWLCQGGEDAVGGDGGCAGSHGTGGWEPRGQGERAAVALGRCTGGCWLPPRLSLFPEGVTGSHRPRGVGTWPGSFRRDRPRDGRQRQPFVAFRLPFLSQCSWPTPSPEAPAGRGLLPVKSLPRVTL